MAYRIYAETNEGSYRPAYDDLNKHRDLGWSAKVVAGRLFLDSDGDGAIRWVHLTASKPVTRDELVEGLLWQFRQQCRCEQAEMVIRPEPRKIVYRAARVAWAKQYDQLMREMEGGK